MSCVIFLRSFSLFWNNVLQFWFVMWTCLSGMFSLSVGMLICSFSLFSYNFVWDWHWYLSLNNFCLKLVFKILWNVAGFRKAFSNFTALFLLLFLCSVKKYGSLFSETSWPYSPPVVLSGPSVYFVFLLWSQFSPLYDHETLVELTASLLQNSFSSLTSSLNIITFFL